MEIIQFEDKSLAHFAYAITSYGEMALIDPGRDPQPYYNCAAAYYAKITAVIETHPHADFVSSHLEIHKSADATIYASKLLGAAYPHKALGDGDTVKVGNITLKALHTPGHSPDSISLVAIDKSGKEHAVFTGDTLFIGDCGRPDLREQAGSITAARSTLAKQMYHSLRKKLMKLPDDVLVYPAHGAGSLCGKALSSQTVSTIGTEKISNWSLQQMNEDEFVKTLLADLPFVPKYFSFDVALNKKGAPKFSESVARVPKRAPVKSREEAYDLDPDVLIIDTRPPEKFKKAHLKKAINLIRDVKFETWLGSIVAPGEMFYLVADNIIALDEVIRATAKIGYEAQIELAFTCDYGDAHTKTFDSNELREHTADYTIVDLRSDTEVKENKLFEHAIHIPLYELRERLSEIPLDKPIVVHCAGGYRSAAGSSIIQAKFNGKVQVYDLSDAVKTFQ